MAERERFEPKHSHAFAGFQTGSGTYQISLSTTPLSYHRIKVPQEQLATLSTSLTTKNVNDMLSAIIPYYTENEA